jgi:hypothetical protein
MKKTFNSPVGATIIIITSVVFGIIFITMLVIKDYTGSIVVALPAALLLHLFLTTKYIISGTELQVKSSFFINTKIDIGTITKVTPTNSILAAPALSLDRLEIFYNRFDSIVISPNNKVEFIAALKEINNTIIVTDPKS